MKTLILSSCMMCMTLMFTTQGYAQPLLLEEPESSWRVFSQAGFDQSLLTLGIGGAWRPQGRLAQLGLTFDSPMCSPGLDDTKLALSSQWELGRWRGVRIPLSVGVDWVRTTNETFTGHNLASTVALMPHWQGQGWLIGLDVSWRHGWLTHLEHTNYYRQVFFAQARDGWYSMGSSELRYGVRGAWRMGDSFEGYAAVGMQRDGVFNVLIPPYYVTLGVSVRF